MSAAIRATSVLPPIDQTSYNGRLQFFYNQSLITLIKAMTDY